MGFERGLGVLAYRGIVSDPNVAVFAPVLFLRDPVSVVSWCGRPSTHSVMTGSCTG